MSLEPRRILSGRRIVDLSVAIENDVPADPRPHNPRIEYMAHADTVEQMAAFFPGLDKRDLPNGEGWAVEKVVLSTHNGTHLDAPYHFATTMDGGARAITIDEVPLDWCIGNGVKLDFRDYDDGHVITVDEMRAELDRIEHQVGPGDIVLVNTSAAAAYGSEEYVDSGCGVGRDATMYLLERGVRVTGTDGWSWDAPFSHTAQRWSEEHDPSIIWEGHKAGREIGYCHLEKLHNLEKLPDFGFEVICLPVKIKAASGGWTRAVALVDEVVS